MITLVIGAILGALATIPLLLITRLGIRVDSYIQTVKLLCSLSSELFIDIKNKDFQMSTCLALECAKMIYTFPPDSAYHSKYRILLAILRRHISQYQEEAGVDVPYDIVNDLKNTEEIRNWLVDFGMPSIYSLWIMTIRQELDNFKLGC